MNLQILDISIGRLMQLSRAQVMEHQSAHIYVYKCQDAAQDIHHPVNQHQYLKSTRRGLCCSLLKIRNPFNWTYSKEDVGKNREDNEEGIQRRHVLGEDESKEKTSVQEPHTYVTYFGFCCI